MSRNRGFTLLEAVVAMTVFVISVVVMLTLVSLSRSTADRGKDAVVAANYLQEGMEAVRIVRDNAWSNIATDGSYRLNAQFGTTPPWQLLSGGSETVNTKFQRTVTISSVRREDTDGDGHLSAGDTIVPSGGDFDDPDSKKITITVSWNVGSRTLTRSVNGYLTNWAG